MTENEMVMPVSPLYNGGNNGGFFGNDGWLAILFLFAIMGGGFGFGGFGGGFGGFGGMYEFPWLLAGQAGINQNTNAGFDNAALTSQLSAIQSTLASNEIANCNRAIDNLQTAYNNQIASMNQNFADSTNLNNNLNGISMALQNCCCENRASIADLKYTIATEACADRSNVNNALRDVLTANTASTQRILDQLCQDKIDAKNEKIADLERQLTMANLAASQTAQTSRILADNAAQTVALEQYLNPVPVPAYVVQNPNCCAQNACGGCGSF